MKVTVNRKAHFNAAHRLYNPSWSNEKNNEIFGLCNNPNYHGHNYELIVSVTGNVDPETGYVIDVKVLKNLISDFVEAKLDHKNLNLDVEEFKNLIPTAENIAIVIYHFLKPHLTKSLELEITLYETPKNYVTFKGY
jgi:6-pyruvoyltetrahydropterin/6-carboxytetrahydropterin synthase